MNYKNEWLQSCFDSTPANAGKIIVKFKNGQEAEYTTGVLNLLKTDPATADIIDAETGEIIFTR